jgi:protease-4
MKRKLFRRGMLAVIPFAGIISMRSVEPYIELIERAEKAKKIKGVLIKLSCQGGSVTATEVLYRALMRLREKKPLYVWTTLAASGGYYVAAACHKIMAPSSAIIGSIGVIAIKPVVSGVMKKVGMKVEVMKEGRLKDESLFFRESTAEGKKKMGAINREIYSDFIDVIAAGRELQKKEVQKIATGEIFTARRGVELGLVDFLGDFREATELLAKEVGVHPERVITLRPRKPFLASLMERGMLSGLQRVFDELFSPEIYYF